jgi:hypothetical protein
MFLIYILVNEKLISCLQTMYSVLKCLLRVIYFECVNEPLIFVGKPEGKRPLGKPRRRWEDNIKAILQEEGCGGMDWIELVQDRERWLALVNAVMNLRVP